MILGRVLKQLWGSRRHKEKLSLISGVAVGVSSRRQPGGDSAPSILCVAGEYHGTGAAEMLCFLLRHLAINRHWRIFAYAPKLDELDRAALSDIGVGFVDEIQPDQFDLMLANTVMWGLNSRRHLHEYLPCVLWVHEGESILWTSKMPLKEFKEAFSWTSHIVFQSRWQAERIYGSFTSGLTPGSRYSIVPNCLPELGEISQPRYRRSQGVKRIVFLGSIYQRKAPQDLIDAVLALGRSDVECLFIGQTDGVVTLSERHQELLRSHPQIRLIGEVPRSEALGYLADSDVLSLPSVDESQPLVLLEAARFGVPVVISDLPVYRDCWVHGLNCLVHPVGDVKLLSAHLLACLEGRAPRPNVEPRCALSTDEFLARFESLLKEQLPVHASSIHRPHL